MIGWHRVAHAKGLATTVRQCATDKRNISGWTDGICRCDRELAEVGNRVARSCHNRINRPQHEPSFRTKYVNFALTEEKLKWVKLRIRYAPKPHLPRRRTLKSS
jgi:hypothetical protein